MPGARDGPESIDGSGGRGLQDLAISFQHSALEEEYADG